MKIRVFCGYSHKDESHRQELEKWLVQLKREHLIEEWHYRKILGGDKWEEEIDKNLENADIVFFLISQDFIASEPCQKELGYAMNSDKKVIPIILRPCSWQDSEISQFQALPKDGKPITDWKSKDEAWLDVYSGLKDIIEKVKNTFTPKSNSISELKKIEFISQNKEQVTIDDVFIFPNIAYQTDIISKEDKKLENFNVIFEEKQRNLFLIEGEERSGKSTIAKELFFESLNNEYLPILIDGNSMFKTRKFDEYFEKTFYTQFNGDYKIWKSKKNKIAIIDNYEHKISPDIIYYVKKEFEKVLILMNSDEFLVYFVDDPLFAEFEVLRIKPLSLVKQEKLIRKWKSIGQNKDALTDREIDLIEDEINNIITQQQIVPRYPPYVLNILQALESFMPRDYRITAFGHCYQVLVVAQLIRKNISPEDIDTCFNFLTELAYDMYRNKDGYYLANYEKFKSNYKNKYVIADRLINRTETPEYPILQFKDNQVNFEHLYIYYFFLGKYFAENPDYKEIEDICNNLYLQQNSFTIIFIIHHTQNQKILDEILLHTMCSFDTEPSSKLTKSETDFMSDLIGELPRKILSNKTVEENREKSREIKESADKEDAEIESKEGLDDNARAKELMEALRIIEVLGQIAKNRAGSFTRVKLREIILETENLGLRILSFFLREMSSNELKEWLRKKLEHEKRRKGKTLQYEKEVTFIEKSTQLLGFLLAMGMIGKISASIGSDKLVDIIHLIAQDNPYPSYELIDLRTQMTHESIDIELIKLLTEKYREDKNWWAFQTLSYSVQDYMNTHKIYFKTEQQLYNLLDLKKRKQDLIHRKRMPRYLR